MIGPLELILSIPAFGDIDLISRSDQYQLLLTSLVYIYFEHHSAQVLLCLCVDVMFFCAQILMCTVLVNKYMVLWIGDMHNPSK